MSKNATIAAVNDYVIADTPEAVLDTASAGPAMYMDAMSCNLIRMRAIVQLLMSEFNEPDGDRLNDEQIAAALWAVDGQIETMGKLLDLTCAADR
ncbi:hypothetical protein [Microbulbifer magnicolonia]|uniref:hypothetical protein n=1 Tax=Microbulbifer magnicolonia TaxID=3109744 RepID=UPI002B402C0C|nr:hypothetical protein [Microbulbifer sp. GG15]